MQIFTFANNLPCKGGFVNKNIYERKEIFINVNKRSGEMFVYTKLWLLLKEKGMKRTDLLEVISSATLAKLGKNENVSTDVLVKICDFLKCQPADIMENITKEDIIETGQKLNDQMNAIMDMLETMTGKTREELTEEFIKEAPVLIEKLQSGTTDLIGLDELMKDSEKKA